MQEFVLDKTKLTNIINTTEFFNMKNLEIKEGFKEAAIEGGKPKQFFHMGPKNDWKKILDGKIKTKIENAFQEQMRELGYI